MPHYDSHILLLYMEKKLSPMMMFEIEQALKKDALLLARLMEISRINALGEDPPAEICVTSIKGEERIFTNGAVNFLRRDLVQLRGMPRPMTHSFFASKTLNIGLTRTADDYVLNINGKKGALIFITGKNYKNKIILEDHQEFLRLPPGAYLLSCQGESIRFSLA